MLFFIPRHLERTTYVPKYETFMKKCYAGEEISAAEHRPSHTLASILCWAARIDGTTFCHGTTFYLYGIPEFRTSLNMGDFKSVVVDEAYNAMEKEFEAV